LGLGMVGVAQGQAFLKKVLIELEKDVSYI
jgi:hypothetical protein